MFVKVGHNQCKDVLLNKECYKSQTYEINKISVSCFDDKIYIFDDAINTLPFGAYSYMYKQK